MVAMEQITIDRETSLTPVGREARVASERGRAPGERGARESLRAQVARLEGELSGIVARGFPHVYTASLGAPSTPVRGCSPWPSWSVSATGWWCACAARSNRRASVRSWSCARATSWNVCGWNRAATSSCACG